MGSDCRLRMGRVWRKVLRDSVHFVVKGMSLNVFGSLWKERKVS